MKVLFNKQSFYTPRLQSHYVCTSPMNHTRDTGLVSVKRHKGKVHLHAPVLHLIVLKSYIYT